MRLQKIPLIKGMLHVLADGQNNFRLVEPANGVRFEV